MAALTAQTAPKNRALLEKLISNPPDTPSLVRRMNLPGYTLRRFRTSIDQYRIVTVTRTMILDMVYAASGGSDTCRASV